MHKKIAKDTNIMQHANEHSLPKGIQAIHCKYGLWICKFSRASHGLPTNPAKMSMRHFDFYDLSHMFDGHGWYYSPDGKIQEVEKGDGILVTPGFKHKYGGYKEFYIEDAISFYGPVADSLVNSGIIKNGILKIGQARRLLPIIELAMDHSEDSQLKANIELQKLLLDLYFENKNTVASENPVFIRLLEEIKKTPERYWSLEIMADFCNLSVSQLKRVFNRRVGMTPKNYVDCLKMQLASEMLTEKHKTVKDIAAALGYSDPYHFSRRFKELKGCSPLKYISRFIR